MISNKIIKSSVFSRFKKIPEQAFYDFYFFYEHYFNQIKQLEFEEYIEIKFNYIQALYKLDKYSLFYFQADEFIKELINQPIFNQRQQYIFEQILFYKAEAYKNENKNGAAIQVFAELVKWKPHNKHYKKKLFIRLFQAAQMNQKQKIALVVIFLFASLILNGICVFILSPFYPQQVELIELVRDLCFAGSILSFIGLQLFYFYEAKRQMVLLTRKDSCAISN